MVDLLQKISSRHFKTAAMMCDSTAHEAPHGDLALKASITADSALELASRLREKSSLARQATFAYACRRTEVSDLDLDEVLRARTCGNVDRSVDLNDGSLSRTSGANELVALRSLVVSLD